MMFSSQRITSLRYLSFSKTVWKEPKFNFGLDRIERRHLRRRLEEVKLEI